jgi:hypothetical protein
MGLRTQSAGRYGNWEGVGRRAGLGTYGRVSLLNAGRLRCLAADNGGSDFEYIRWTGDRDVRPADRGRRIQRHREGKHAGGEPEATMIRVATILDEHHL